MIFEIVQQKHISFLEPWCLCPIKYDHKSILLSYFKTLNWIPVRWCINSWSALSRKILFFWTWLNIYFASMFRRLPTQAAPWMSATAEHIPMFEPKNSENLNPHITNYNSYFSGLMWGTLFNLRSFIKLTVFHVSPTLVVVRVLLT